MKTNRTILTMVALLVAFSLNAQVAINTDGSSPDASTMLDIQSSNSGTSFSNLDIADMSTAAPVTSPKTGLIAYNTNSTTGPGLVMWTGTEWVMFELEGINWALLGNAGTSVGTNFLGTSDYNSLAFRANNTERMRVQRDGRVSVNSTGGFSTSTFYSLASDDDNAIDANAAGTGAAVYAQQTGNGNALHGYADGTGRAVYGYQNGSGYAVRGYNAGTGTGVIGRANKDTSYAIWGYNVDASGTGLLASGGNYSGSYLTDGTGVAGSGPDGVYGKGKDSDGTGVIGTGNDGDSTFTITGGSGGAFTGAYGVYGKVDNNSTGTGVVGVGNNIPSFSVTTTGSGGAFTGQEGVYGKGIAATGTGVIGLGNNGAGYYVYTGRGSGGAFTGNVCGVFGYASNSSGDRYGGYFATGGGRYAYVGGRYSGTDRKIVGNGTVSTIVKNTNGEIVTLVCPEAPESLFQDYGIGQLVNGKAHITIDPDLAININVSPEHPLKVFITLEGDCKGVYVTNKSANGFDVIELQGGSASVPFSWQIVATRANEEYVTRDGTTEISDYSHRFQPAPGPLETKMERGTTNMQKAHQQKTIEAEDSEAEIKGQEAKEEIEDNEK